ncbi:MAG: hypothetical protein LCH79_00215 [Proteobacteria bacterium]|jgi:hypothetical protein|nr:hypothetical protein [Pseudomonadota bacterium]
MNSRLSIDRTTLLPSIQTFGELSHFLRGSVADEDCRQFSESMGTLATHIEAIVAALRLSRQRASVAPLLMDLLTVLRGHRALVVGLGVAWRGLYEYAAYLQALNNLRVLIGQWLLDGGSHSEMLGLSADDFELVAWRTLGEGMLLIDMYEQLAARAAPEESAVAALEEPRVERAMAWWKKLRL